MEHKAFLIVALLFFVILPVYADTVELSPAIDGYATQTTDANWYSMRNAGGEDSGSATTLVLGPLDSLASSSAASTLRVVILSFNTSTIPDNSTINSAHLYVNIMNKAAKSADPYYNITITGGKLAANTSIATGDYDGWATYEGYGPSTELANRIENNSINVTAGSGLNDFTLNAAGLAYIDKQQYSVFYLRSGWHALNQTPPYVSSGVAGSVTTVLLPNTTAWARPRLVIDYTPLAPTPVASFTTNSTDGTAPFAVLFTDTSSETPTSWNWSFGDGTYSTDQNPTHSYTTPGIYTATLTATNSGGSDVSDTIRIGVSDPLGWYDPFTTDTSSQYGDQNDGFVWDTVNGILNATNPNGYTPGKMTFYKTSPFFGGTYSYFVTPKMFDSLRVPSGEHYAEFIYGAQERYQGNFYENGTLQAIYFKNSTADGRHGILHIVSIGGTHYELEEYTFTVQKDHTYNITLVWNPYSSTNVSEIYVDDVLGIVSANKSGNATGWAGFSVHHHWQAIDWYDNFRINNASGVIPTPTPTPTPTITVLTTIATPTPSGVPVPSFIANVTCGSVPFYVQFNDTSTGVPTEWNWTSNGNYSESQNPVFYYDTVGRYFVNLNATNSFGSAYLNETNYIRAVPDWYECPLVTTIPPTTIPNLPAPDVLDNWMSALFGNWMLWLFLLLGALIIIRG